MLAFVWRLTSFFAVGAPLAWSIGLSAPTMSPEVPGRFGRQPTSQSTFARPPTCASSILVEAAAVIAGAALRVGQVWPGYWPQGQSFILTDPGVAVLLYGPADSPPGFEPLPFTGGSNARVEVFHVMCGIIPDLRASRGRVHVEYPIGETVVTAVALQDDLASTLGLMYHEAFHAYQRGAFASPELVADSLDAAVLSDPDFKRLWEVERRLLAEALKEADLEATHRLAAEFLAVREERVGRVPQAVREAERELERVEGTARFVGTAAMLKALESSTKSLSGLLRDELADPPQAPPFGPHWEIRVRAYASGAAIGALLERLTDSWRERVENGEMLDAILSDAIRYRAVRSESLLDQAMLRHGARRSPPSADPASFR